MKNEPSGMIRTLTVAAALLTPLAAPAASVNEDAVRTTLENGLQSKNPIVRKQAVQSLALLGGWEPYQSRIEAMLQDKNVNVRVAAIMSMMVGPGDNTIDVLKGALNDPAPEVTFAAAKALFVLSDPAGEKALVAVLNGDVKTTSGLIAQEKLEASEILHDPDKATAFIIEKGFVLAPIPGLGVGVSVLETLFFKKKDSGRAATTRLLSTSDNPEVRDALRRALSDKEPAVRAAAVEVNALRNDPGVLDSVVPLLQDKKEMVRLWASSCYLRLAGLKDTPAPETAADAQHPAAAQE
jgi:HEAT repeat protein